MLKKLDSNKLKVLELVEKGLRPVRAVKSLGLSGQTLYDWKENDLRFLNNLESAESRYQYRLIRKTMKFMEQAKAWQGGIALLERRFPDEFAAKSVTELQGKNGQPVAFKIDMAGGYIPPMGAVVKEIRKRAEPS